MWISFNIESKSISKSCVCEECVCRRQAVGVGVLGGVGVLECGEKSRGWRINLECGVGMSLHDHSYALAPGCAGGDQTKLPVLVDHPEIEKKLFI